MHEVRPSGQVLHAVAAGEEARSEQMQHVPTYEDRLMISHVGHNEPPACMCNDQLVVSCSRFLQRQLVLTQQPSERVCTAIQHRFSPRSSLFSRSPSVSLSRDIPVCR